MRLISARKRNNKVRCLRRDRELPGKLVVMGWGMGGLESVGRLGRVTSNKSSKPPGDPSLSYNRSIVPGLVEETFENDCVGVCVYGFVFAEFGVLVQSREVAAIGSGEVFYGLA
jgi:hypothetical protein